MKTTHMLIGLMAAGSMVMAGSVTIPNTFVAGQTAKASEVNENFRALEIAATENADHIRTHETSIASNNDHTTSNLASIQENSDKITNNENDISTKIDEVTARGGLRGVHSGNTITFWRSNGVVSVQPSAFRADNTQTCFSGLALNLQFHFLSSSSASACAALAPVSLPDGAEIVSFSCEIVKNDGGTDNMDVGLYGQKLDAANLGEISLTVGQISRSSSDSDSYVETDSSMTDIIVDNANYAYVITFNPPNNTNTIEGARNAIRTCHIHYKFN